MNVAALLHDSPSDDRTRRHARQEQEQNAHQQQQQQQHQQPQPQQPPPPIHRPPHHSPPLERPRDAREHDRHPLDVSHPPFTSQPLQHRRSPPPFAHSRPPSPPRHPPPFGAPLSADFPAHSQRVPLLPPPSQLLQEQYDVPHQSRRANPEGMSHPLERPPGPPNAPSQAQMYVVEHRNPSLPPKTHPHHHHHHASHTHPSTPSSMHMPPPPSRSTHASPPHTHHIHGPGQGSIPLFPTQVGPGVPPGGPPSLHPSSSSSPGMGLRIGGEQSPMYGLSYQGQNPSPHQQSHSSLSHHSQSSHHDRHRGRGSSTSSAPPGPGGAFDLKSTTASPVMTGLRPAPYDERERDPGPGGMGRPRGPPLLGVGASGPGMPPTPIGPGRPQDSMSHILGPGVHPRERERERERAVGMPRERDRRDSGASQHESPGAIRREHEQRERERQAQRERENLDRQIMQEREMQERERSRREREREREMQMQREQREREQRERDRDREREQYEREQRDREQRDRDRERERERREREQEGFRQHAHDLMGVGGVGLGLGAGMGLSPAEMEDRERSRKQQMQPQGIAHPMRVQPQPQLPPQNQHQLQHQHQHQHQPPMSMSIGPPHGQQHGGWPRFHQTLIGPEDERREMERRRGHEDVPVQWETEAPRAPGRGKSRTSTKDRDREERERKDMQAQRDDRKRASVRDKDRSDREREQLTREREREREREQREKAAEEEYRRDRELALQKEAQYELMERERVEREMRDMEAIRAARAREGQGQAQAHLQQSQHHHLHSHSVSGSPLPGAQMSPHVKSSSKQGPMGPAPPLPGDTPLEYAHQWERPGPPKGAGPMPSGMGIPPQRPLQVAHQQIPHPHQMPPGPHMRQHPPPDMYPPGMPIGYPRRPSPPPLPFHDPAAQAIPAPYMFPRSSSPTLVLPVRHLGTFVFPRTPFPFFDFPSSFNETGAPSDPTDIRATIYLPSRFIPLTRPPRPRIWGGALIPAVPPLTGAQRQLCMQFCGTAPQYGRPWPEEVREGRRVYTDDSDLFLCALHAGWVSWSAARRARREGRDLRMEVRLTREARFVGGFGAGLRARERGGQRNREREREPGEMEVESLGQEDDGNSLLSSGWGNGHDGAGVEVLKAVFVPAGTAHSFGLRNRSQRMLEYAERRSALGCAPRLGRKRRRLHGASSFADGERESAVQLRLDQVDEELSATRVMVFGTDSSWPEIGFKYHPDALKTVLFPQPASEMRPSKRRKLARAENNTPSDTQGDGSGDEELIPQRAVVVETLWESFLISQRGQIPSSELESDKENAATDGGSVDSLGTGTGGRRYVVALLPNAGGTHGKLPRCTGAQDGGAGQHAEKSTADGNPTLEKNDRANGLSEMSTLNGLTQSTSGGDTADSEKIGDAVAAVPAASTDGGGAGAQSKAVPVDREMAVTPAPSSKASDESTEDGTGPIQILHRDLGEENFEFLADGINVVSTEVVNGMRKGWKLEAQQWKWVQVGVTS